MKNTDRIYVAGQRGMVGSTVCRVLEKNGYTNLVVRTHKIGLDTASVTVFYAAEKARCGGDLCGWRWRHWRELGGESTLLYENEMPV